MADRNHTSTNGTAMSNGTSRPGAPVNPRGSATLAGVRRNLFQGQGQVQGHVQGQPTRARRPAQAALAPSGAGDAADTVRPDADVPSSEATDIVVRDSHGEIEWGEPPSPDLDDQGDLPFESQRDEMERTQGVLFPSFSSEHELTS